MKDSTAFTSRLQKLLEYYDLSASGFATTIGVQRSSISHVLSGRNKPSLDFVMKLLHHFNEVSIEWLIDGKGSFPKSETTPTPIQKTEEKIAPILTQEKETEKALPPIISELTSKKNEAKEITKIIVLYSDGSFEAFQN